MVLAMIAVPAVLVPLIDRKSTRLNSSHLVISYAVFCLKKKKSYSGCCGTALSSAVASGTTPSPAGSPPRCCCCPPSFFFFNDTATTEISPLPLPDAFPISRAARFFFPNAVGALKRGRQLDQLEGK